MCVCVLIVSNDVRAKMSGNVSVDGYVNQGVKREQVCLYLKTGTKNVFFFKQFT